MLHLFKYGHDAGNCWHRPSSSFYSTTYPIMTQPMQPMQAVFNQCKFLLAHSNIMHKLQCNMLPCSTIFCSTCLSTAVAATSLLRHCSIYFSTSQGYLGKSSQAPMISNYPMTYTSPLPQSVPPSSTTPNQPQAMVVGSTTTLPLIAGF